MMNGMKLTVDPKTNEFTITGKIEDLAGRPSGTGKNDTLLYQQYTKTTQVLSNGRTVAFSATIMAPTAK